MPIYSDLGHFELGTTFLGATLGIALQDESLTPTDSVEQSFILQPGDSVSFSESIRIILTPGTEDLSVTDDLASMRFTIVDSNLTFADAQSAYYTDLQAESIGLLDAPETTWTTLDDESLALSEQFQYVNSISVGVIARIVLRLDITNEEFCNTILEAGMSIYLNNVAQRAFLFPKQSGQKFDNGKNIIPGDSVMFSCPTLTLALGDTIYHNYIYYSIIAFKDEFIGGNWIYRKSGLRRTSPILSLPTPTGLVASPNYEGKTTLTWDAINELANPNFKDFVIGRTPTTFGTLFPTDIESKLNTPPTVVVGTPGTVYYLVDTVPTGAWVGHVGEITRWDGAAWVFIGSFITDDLLYVFADNNYYYCTTPPGSPPGTPNTWAQVPWEIVETTKNNSFTDKNLYANYAYSYVVWVRGLLDTRGRISAIVVTPIDITPPPAPGGLR